VTIKDDLLTAYKVSCEFKFDLLRQRVFSFRDSLISCVKNAHLAGISEPKSTGELLWSGPNASFGDFSLLALSAVDLASRWAWVRPRTAERGYCDFEHRKIATGRLLSRLRAKSEQTGSRDFMNLWSGQAARLARRHVTAANPPNMITTTLSC
jgi:hypothetical protein